MLNSKEIGLRLIELRGGKTQEEVANDLGISRSAIAMYESGERVPRDNIKVKLATYYESTVQDIFFDKCAHVMRAKI
ncbi:MAG: helix-turn-helix transcriptional regulator [Bacteroidales bacterium]